MRRNILRLIVLWGLVMSAAYAAPFVSVPVLVYHNIDPVKKGSMTISTQKFEAQMLWLKEHGYTVIPLQALVEALQGKGKPLPAKSVVITDDDGRSAVYQYMLPIIRKYNYPITLFIFPQIISHVSYALTWDQLKAMQQTGLVDIQDHTYWHPNFKQERRHLSDAAYAKLVHVQLVTSKQVLEKKLGTPITLLAWPFGIYNPYLEAEAKKAGYIMAFSIDARHAETGDNFMAVPRYMII